MFNFFLNTRIYLYTFLSVLGNNPDHLHPLANALEKPGWKLAFHDEFNSKELDRNIWQTLPHYGERFHPGPLKEGKPLKEYYADRNFEFTDSTIKLVAKKELLKIQHRTYGPLEFNYTVGWIENKYPLDQQYGYYEIRCKTPNSAGTWPAFWLSSREYWPPEIDIFEFYGKTHKLLKSNYHWKAENGKKEMVPKGHRILKPWEGFHTYGLEWDEEYLKWYYDNKLLRVFNRKPIQELQYSMRVIVNSGVDNRKPQWLEKGTFPNYFEVDYVRVYVKDSTQKQ